MGRAADSTCGKKPSSRNFSTSPRVQLGLDRAANHLRATTEDDHRCDFLAAIGAEQLFLGKATAVKELPTLPGL
jgi:hypothetical protein